MGCICGSSSVVPVDEDPKKTISVVPNEDPKKTSSVAPVDEGPKKRELYPISESVDIQTKFLQKALSISESEGAQLQKTKTGATNLIFIFTCSSLKAVVHIFGNGMENLDHENEKKNIRTIGFSKILAEFENGYVLNYFEGDILTLETVREPRISNLIAKKIGLFHSLSPIKQQNDIFKILDAFRVPLHSQMLDEKAESLRSTLEKELGSTDFILTHGDLHAANIILQTDGNDVEFIDYEATAYTWALYDIAFHFLMMTGFQVDLRRFPTVEEQSNFLTVYYTVLEKAPPAKEKVDDALRKLQLLVKLGELIIACWGFLQAKNPTKDFPYQQYAEARLKSMEHTLPLPEGHELAQGALVPQLAT